MKNVRYYAFHFVAGKKEIKHEITGKSLSVTFDGTTRMGEIFVIVICFVDLD